MDARLLRGLRARAEETGQTLSAVLTEAAREYLERASVRPAFREATEEVLDQHAELLQRLAR